MVGGERTAHLMCGSFDCKGENGRHMRHTIRTAGRITRELERRRSGGGEGGKIGSRVAVRGMRNGPIRGTWANNGAGPKFPRQQRIPGMGKVFARARRGIACIANGGEGIRISGY